MIFVPLPFVVTLLLLILIFQLLRQGRELPSSRFFILLLGFYVVLSVLIGVRWGYDILTFLPVQSVLAAAWAPLAWLCFRSLSRSGPTVIWPGDIKHLVPPILILLMVLLSPRFIDLFLIGIYLLYAILLAHLAFSGIDKLRMVRLDEAKNAHRALVITALALFFFAGIDIFISYDMRSGAGDISAKIVAFANVPVLLTLGLMATLAGQGRSPEAEAASVPEPDVRLAEEDDFEVFDKINSLLSTKEIYRDFDLNLDRLARKSAIPARRISEAINRVKGQNISQFVNELRVGEACRLLKNTEARITDVMFEAGFLTKSNFNREFKRVTGLSPKDWRARFSD
ncbi:AraC family transcriptional regulator [Kiloniella laminariae]|uniref:AraC family transcriptional regulator n=1 Tax=Kiloniella laminariae TaxID=454162 RepID=A0ABT4LN65_9PROT|nr:AraC family transcriptional regulator [Kiloniella laminariae]MCZ4282524.1 AraC family transcriptional regulator [Kiloniella laminariae]